MPPGFNLYRVSKGIRKPKATLMLNKEAEQCFDDWHLTHEANYKITDSDRGFNAIVHKRYYNRESTHWKEDEGIDEGVK
jgi:hypothetical protein